MEVVKINSQIWASENLKAELFSNGEGIVKAKNMQDWIDVCNARKPCCCAYDFKDANISKYGLLYNKYVITNEKTIAPEGFRVPTKNDWDILIEGLGGIVECLSKMKSTKGWLKVGWDAMNGSNESGFNATPGGDLFHIGTQFRDEKYGVLWWTEDGFTPHITQYDKKKFRFHDSQPSFRDNVDTKPDKSGKYIRLIAY